MHDLLKEELDDNSVVVNVVVTTDKACKSFVYDLLKEQLDDNSVVVNVK